MGRGFFLGGSPQTPAFGSYSFGNHEGQSQQRHNVSRQFRSLTLDEAAAEHADLTAQGLRIGPYDTLIAAIALVHNLTLVTHNTRECGRVPGLRLEDWE